MKKFKRGKYLFGSLLVFAFVTTLLLNLKQENEIGDINNYTPIALLEDAIVYNYINDDDALVIGYYDIASKKQSDVIYVRYSCFNCSCIFHSPEIVIRKIWQCL